MWGRGTGRGEGGGGVRTTHQRGLNSQCRKRKRALRTGQGV